MSFVALLIHLKPVDTGPAPSWDEVWGTGETILRELRAATLASSGTHHTTQQGCVQPAPLTPTLLLDEHHRLSLRVTVLGEPGLPSIASLLDTLAAHPLLRLGSRRYMAEAADLSHSAWAGLSTWADFLAPPYGQTIKLHLGTPLVLLPDVGAAGDQSFHFPFPRPLFAELARRWQELDGPSLPVGSGDLLSLLSNGGIVLADYRLRLAQVPLDGKVQSGFRGWTCYECRRSAPAARAMLAALSRFAFFAGAGAFTESGMGATRIATG
jgi:CRISPR-associated endoribonuclease Cas6